MPLLDLPVHELPHRLGLHERLIRLTRDVEVLVDVAIDELDLEDLPLRVVADGVQA